MKHDGVTAGIATLQATKRPLEALQLVGYEGQPANMRQYRSGFEQFFNNLPILRDDDPMLQAKLHYTHEVMQSLATSLSTQQWVRKPLPSNQFERTIVGMELPDIQGSNIQEGREVLVAQWGDGYTSPVHGHSVGLLYEHLLYGKMRVNTYRLVSPGVKIARPVDTTIYEGWSSIASRYTWDNKPFFKRQALIHNFTSIGESASLHYVAEHTRDGRDNTFAVEYFEEQMALRPEDFEVYDSLKAMYSRIGDIYLVRSLNVPEYGDHFIVITGHPIVKKHGLRPQDVAIHAPKAEALLNQFSPRNGLIILKLKEGLKQSFFDFHGITTQDQQITFPQA